jgi:DNA repair exonuclease SbcCD nuclease subunit
MIVEHHGKRIYTLGDIHVGRSFVNNVPLHRRSDRERMVWSQFYRELSEFDAGCDYHIHMGDLFDKDQVSHTIVLQAAAAYLAAARRNPHHQFVFLQGNHDASRELQINMDFDTFSIIVERVPNIHIIRGAVTSLPPGVGLFGWLPFVSASEMVSETEGPYEIAFGHWDTDLRVDPFNLILTMLLRERGVSRAYTGQVHLPDQFSRDGVGVTPNWVDATLRPWRGRRRHMVRHDRSQGSHRA